MFDIVESLQGPSRAAVDSEDDTNGQASSSTEKPAGQPTGRFSLWGMATALAENVKKSTADIAARSVSVTCYAGAVVWTPLLMASCLAVGVLL